MRLAAWSLALLLTMFVSTAHAATVQYVYDEIGRLIAVIDPASDTTEYLYDDVGNLQSVARRSSSQLSIVSFTPARGVAGQTVTIVGTGFSATPAQNQVQFNGTAATVSSATPTSIVTSVPVGATTGPISVTTPTGTATSAVPFVVREAPQITNFSPAIGQPGSNLTITGRGFAEPDLTVNVNNASAQVVSTTLDTVVSRIPTATGGKISVTTPLGTATTTDDFFIVPAPHTTADVVATGRIAIDGPGRVLALPAGKVGLVLFDGVAGSAGMRVLLSDSTLSSGTLSVFKPDGTPLATGISFGTAGASVLLSSLPVTGTYGVRVVADPAASGIVTVAAATATGAANALSVGDTVLASFAAGQVGQFTFQGQIGQNLGLDVSNITLPSGSGLQVLRPDGVTVVNTSIGTGPTGVGLRIPTFTQAGTYTIRITPPANGTGDVRLLLWTDVTGTLTVGTQKNITVAFRNQLIRQTFTGAVGDSLGLDVSNITLPSGSGLQVLRPDGVAVVNTSIGTGLTGVGLRIPTFTQAGTYTIRITPPANGTGDVRLLLWTDVTGTLTVGTQKNITVAFRNQLIRQTFTGAVGDSLGLDVSNITLPSGSGLQVLRPDGVAVVNTSIGTGSTGVGLRIPTFTVTGTYTVQITPPANGTGDVRLLLWTDVTGTLTVGTQKNITVAFRNQLIRQTFTGAVGDSLGLDVSNITLPSGSGLQVLRPDGVAVVNTSIGTGLTGVGLRIPTFTQAGVYTVLITPPANGTGSVQLKLWSDVTDTLTIDTPYALTIQDRNQQARLPFNGTTGQNLGISLSGVTLPAGGLLQVLTPAGGAVVNTSFGAAGIIVNIPTLTSTGIHTVSIIPNSSGTGNVSVNVFNR